MNPGEYIGKDGRTYRWVSVGNGRKYRPVSTTALGHDCEMVYLSAEDWPAAKAALDDLLEAESEWVEIDDNARIKRDGSNPQVKNEGGTWLWKNLTNPIGKRWPKAYCKGREVAQAEQADLRDAARELVSMALTPAHLQDTQWSDTLTTIVKKVEAKL